LLTLSYYIITNNICFIFASAISLCNLCFVYCFPIGGGGGYGLSGDDHNLLHPQFVPNYNAFDHYNKSSLSEILEARKVSFTEISNF